MMDNRSLVVVVDTNRPEQVLSREVLESCNRVAVIDHHRRAATYIEGAALNYHEPYASSASELVTELLQYIADPTDLMRAEAEALLAGIVLDTKNFSMRTGGRTFEAAAFLRRNGADPHMVSLLFKDDEHTVLTRARIITEMKQPLPGLAVAVHRCSCQDKDTPVIVAQAADELLTMDDIRASVVFSQNENGVSISAAVTDPSMCR